MCLCSEQCTDSSKHLEIRKPPEGCHGAGAGSGAEDGPEKKSMEETRQSKWLFGLNGG